MITALLRGTAAAQSRFVLSTVLGASADAQRALAADVRLNVYVTCDGSDIVGAHLCFAVKERLCWESSGYARCPQSPQASGFWEVSRLWTCGQRAVRSHGAWRAPDGVMLEHRIEDSEQLAHHGGERNLGRFAAPPQAAVKGG